MLMQELWQLGKAVLCTSQSCADCALILNKRHLQSEIPSTNDREVVLHDGPSVRVLETCYRSN